MNKCKHLKQKFNNKFECKLNKKGILYRECKNCNSYERKDIKTKSCTYKYNNTLNRTKTSLKKVSKKQAKLERNRKSVFTKDFSKCIECGYNIGKIDKHECIGGSNRSNSIKYDLIVPLCRKCHQNNQIIIKWKIKAQEYFINRYGYDKFIKIFKIDFKEKMTRVSKP